MSYNTVPRRSLRGKARESFLIANDRRCIYCKQPIRPDQKWQDCHIIAREMGGSDDMSNRGPGHVECHKIDTREVAKVVAKSNRIRIKHGLQESRRTRPKPKMRSPGFRKGPKANIPARQFEKRGKK